MANWQNLEKDIERASTQYTPDMPDYIVDIHLALEHWPGLKTILLELIARDRYHLQQERERQQETGPIR